MAEEDAADRASQEIKTLLRKLDPNHSSHKDRIRRLNKFRNFVTGEGSSNGVPEFYDDDIPLLLLGSAAPPVLLGDHTDFIEEMAAMSGGNADVHGLLQACGSPSVEHDNMLKRSARHAMALLKFLVCDFVESGGASKDELNLFAQCFCSFPVDKYRYMSLDLHLIGDQRGGAKEAACAVMVLLLTRHMLEDGETPSPISTDDLLASPQARKAFDVWCAQGKNTTKQQLEQIKANAQKRIDNLKKQEAAEIGSPGGGPDADRGGLADADDDVVEDSDDDDEIDEDDALAAFKRRKKTGRMDATHSNDLDDTYGPALRWEDSQLYREQRARQKAHEKMQEQGGAGSSGKHHGTVRDSQEAAAELAEREEEKAKVMRKDPLGLKGQNFDLMALETNQVDFLEQALLELQEELRKAEQGGEDDQALRAKKESLEQILDAIIGVAGAPEMLGGSRKSVLPTDSNFDPILFLTLVHRNATYEELVGSMNRLSTDTQNQVQQLQNMVRENFALFLRCADGIDTFNEKTISQSGPGLVDRLNRLDALAESCAHQAKKSFKPLLDNANEVRKVQSALAVLRRVEDVLQAPYLMRQHVENGRFSAALKAYRRVQVIDESCNIEILNHVKDQASECAREARRELEFRLGQDKSSVTSLLDSIRDLTELLELDIPHDPKEAEKVTGPRYRSAAIKGVGMYSIGGISVNVRDFPPALACLLLQSAHFAAIVSDAIEEADNTTQRIFDGESLSSPTKIETESKGDGIVGDESKTDVTTRPKPQGANNNQWKYDVLEARSIATIRAVEIISKWLPRLLDVCIAAREDEKRRAARIGFTMKEKQMTPFEVVVSNVAPSLNKLVEHAAFCGLGSAPRGSGMEIKMSFGKKSPEKLRALLKSPLPPSQSSRVGKELATMVEVLAASNETVNEIRPLPGEDATTTSTITFSPLDECRTLAEQSVMTIERRRCIYAFDICARGCSTRATGSGKFDAESLLGCLRTLSEELTRPDQCASEVEKGCELVIRKCCDGLASYVRDRGDTARLSAVAECADVLQDRMSEVVREIGFLTSNQEAVEEVMMEDIMGLEGAMFDEYLESIRLAASSSCRMGWLDIKVDLSKEIAKESPTLSFPPYLSSSLLAIVRCRAQVEQALGAKIRRSEGQTYQHIAMSTVALGIAEAICEQIQQRKMSLKVRQADRLANELQFLMNTLKNYLTSETTALLDGTRRMLCSKAGRGAGIQGDGPDGLAALEDLERLGRVYVLCLGE